MDIIQLGKKPVDLVLDFLSCLWEYAKEQITRDIGAVADLSENAKLWLQFSFLMRSFRFR